ncbi:hypothetical protein AHAS_Ahas11G0126900 [Arachis hypogaea]
MAGGLTMLALLKAAMARDVGSEGSEVRISYSPPFGYHCPKGGAHIDSGGPFGRQAPIVPGGVLEAEEVARGGRNCCLKKRVADAESRVAVILVEAELLKAEVAKLKKEKEQEGLLTDAKDVISVTEDTLKA